MNKLKQIIVGLVVLVAALTPTSFVLAKSSYYTNVRGNKIHVPVKQQAPAGSTAKCRDGTYSFSQTRRGTCSHHGGVAQWLH